MTKKIYLVLWLICVAVSAYLAHKRYVESASIWQVAAALYMLMYARNRVKKNVHIRKQRRSDHVS